MDKAKVLHQCVPTTPQGRGIGRGPGHGTRIHCFTISTHYYGRVSSAAPASKSGGPDPPAAVSPSADNNPLLLLLLTAVVSDGHDDCCSWGVEQLPQSPSEDKVLLPMAGAVVALLLLLVGLALVSGSPNWLQLDVVVVVVVVVVAVVMEAVVVVVEAVEDSLSGWSFNATTKSFNTSVSFSSISLNLSLKSIKCAKIQLRCACKFSNTISRKWLWYRCANTWNSNLCIFLTIDSNDTGKSFSNLVGKMDSSLIVFLREGHDIIYILRCSHSSLLPLLIKPQILSRSRSCHVWTTTHRAVFNYCSIQ